MNNNKWTSKQEQLYIWLNSNRRRDWPKRSARRSSRVRTDWRTRSRVWRPTSTTSRSAPTGSRAVSGSCATASPRDARAPAPLRRARCSSGRPLPQASRPHPAPDAARVPLEASSARPIGHRSLPRGSLRYASHKYCTAEYTHSFAIRFVYGLFCKPNICVLLVVMLITCVGNFINATQYTAHISGYSCYNTDIYKFERKQQQTFRLANSCTHWFLDFKSTLRTFQLTLTHSLASCLLLCFINFR